MEQDEVKKKIIYFLNSVRDDGRDVELCVDFLNKLIVNSSRESPAPVLEIITLIKYEKPILFYELRKRLKVRTNFKMLFELDLDYVQAKKKLF
ncbi:hypothetical protein MHB77_23915 [Paenibacillus sp. FSL K6-3166]|uniref:hypothetical protein n=1 Tax=unclassified Paenibacillus TaxID=185978 RepID=UPI000B9FA651|nr:hypothetical protein [Paenibacillus sp. VTT E-133291]OZQ78309.1 hypothetical protein CA598_29335 [Paenibacillus sp. VTT E-133291]